MSSPPRKSTAATTISPPQSLKSSWFSATIHFSVSSDSTPAVSSTYLLSGLSGTRARAAGHIPRARMRAKAKLHILHTARFFIRLRVPFSVKDAVHDAVHKPLHAALHVVG